MLGSCGMICWAPVELYVGLLWNDMLGACGIICRAPVE